MISKNKAMDVILNANKRYTYADYLTWLDDKRRELLDGFIRLMSPAPSSAHAQVSIELAVLFKIFIKQNDGKCQVFCAPFDVRLPKNPDEVANDKIFTVVQPDICIICDESKIDKRGCLGAPDMIVEILSGSSLKYDLNNKFNLYEEAGVKEYWVVTPEEPNVIVFLLQNNGKYDNGAVYEDDMDVPVQTLPGLNLKVRDIYQKPL